MSNFGSSRTLELLLGLCAPTAMANTSDLSERVTLLERELERTRDLLRLTLMHLNDQDISLELRAHSKRTEASPEPLPSGLHERADAIMLKINVLLSKGEDIQALRFYRQETGAVWDEIHDTIASWNTDYHQTLARVTTHLRHRRIKDSLDEEAPS